MADQKGELQANPPQLTAEQIVKNLDQMRAEAVLGHKKKGQPDQLYKQEFNASSVVSIPPPIVLSPPNKNQVEKNNKKEVTDFLEDAEVLRLEIAETLLTDPRSERMFPTSSNPLEYNAKAIYYREISTPDGTITLKFYLGGSNNNTIKFTFKGLTHGKLIQLGISPNQEGCGIEVLDKINHDKPKRFYFTQRNDSVPNEALTVFKETRKFAHNYTRP